MTTFLSPIVYRKDTEKVSSQLGLTAEVSVTKRESIDCTITEL